MARNAAASSSHVPWVAAFFLLGRLIATVTTPFERVTSMVSMCGDDTDGMGYNPNRKYVRRKGDLAFVVAGVAIALALLIWAFLG